MNNVVPFRNALLVVEGITFLEMKYTEVKFHDQQKGRRVPLIKSGELLFLNIWSPSL